MSHPHYLVLNNFNGNKAYVVGDVHGNIGVLDAALARLKPQDTLIIAGDLIDRGERDPFQPTSRAVLDRLIANKTCGGVIEPRICAVKGNHELDFLRIVESLKKASTVELNRNSNILYDLIAFFANGGAWIIDRETEFGKLLFQIARQYAASKSQHLGHALKEHLLFAVEKKKKHLLDLCIPQLSMYRNYIEQLPFIIKISDTDRSAWVVHADCPFTDEQLDEKISGHIPLTEAEITHLVKARPNQFSSIRDENALLVYTGHNIIDEKSRRDKDPCHAVFPVREEANTLNLDVGAYYTNGLICIDHFEGEVCVITAGRVSGRNRAFLNDAANEIREYLENLVFVPSCCSSFS